jgi:hypothetical protein
MDNVSDVPIDVTLTGGEGCLEQGLVCGRAPYRWAQLGTHQPFDPRSKTALIADAALYNSVLTAEGEPALSADLPLSGHLCRHAAADGGWR